MRTAVFAASACLSFAAYAPAFADNPAKDGVQTRKAAAAYAACVVHSHHDKASEAILSVSDNHEIMNRFSAIVDSSCVSAAGPTTGGFRFPNDSYRGALANALVNADFATHGFASFVDRLPLAHPGEMPAKKQDEMLAGITNAKKRAQFQKDMDKQNALIWLSIFGECVVRRDPEDARFWLLTKSDTPEEMSRIKALSSSFNACLTAGETLKFDRTTMRGTVAVNYYRLAMATVVPGSGSIH